MLASERINNKCLLGRDRVSKRDGDSNRISNKKSAKPSLKNVFFFFVFRRYSLCFLYYLYSCSYAVSLISFFSLDLELLVELGGAENREVNRGGWTNGTKRSTEALSSTQKKYIVKSFLFLNNNKRKQQQLVPQKNLIGGDYSGRSEILDARNPA